MTALPAVFKKGSPVIGSEIDLIREPYTITPAAYGDESAGNVTAWKIPKGQFDHFSFTTQPPAETFSNTYPVTNNSRWTELDGWVLSGEGLVDAVTGDVANVNDGSLSMSDATAYCQWQPTGMLTFTVDLPAELYVSKVIYNGIVSYNYSGGVNYPKGHQLVGIMADDTEIILADYGTVTSDTISFEPVKLVRLILRHDCSVGIAHTPTGMLIKEVDGVYTAPPGSPALVHDSGNFFATGETGLVSIGSDPDWSQAVGEGYIDNAWLSALTAPEMVFEAPGYLTVTYGELVPQIAIQDNLIDFSGVANVSSRSFDDAGTGIRLAMSPNSFVWYVWDGVAFVSIGSLTADSAGADTLYNQGMIKAVYDAIPLADYERFLQESGRMFYAYGTNNPRAEIVEHQMTADGAAPFVPHTAGAMQVFSDRITYTANVAGEFLFVIST